MTIRAGIRVTDESRHLMGCKKKHVRYYVCLKFFFFLVSIFQYNWFLLYLILYISKYFAEKGL